MDEATALARLHEAGDAIRAGARRRIPAWVEEQVDRIVTAWGRATAEVVGRARLEAREAGGRAAERVDAELAALFSLDPSAQRRGPLEVIRSAYAEPTAVLQAAGIPGVVRDEVDERLLPDDVYDLAPRRVQDLGDADLGGAHLAWGIAKAAVLRARGGPGRDPASSA